jgi:hypothetical protein
VVREPIYAALYARIAAAAGFKTISRRLRHWDDVPQGDQPAMFMAQKSESVSTTPGLPSVSVMAVDVYIYAHTQGDKTIAPGTILNPLLDAVVGALAPDPITNKCTLGGLVQHAWIDGTIETDEGVLGDQAVCVIPITIKTA